MNKSRKPSQAPVKVALLEDDEDQAELIGIWLEDDNFRVTTAHSGEEMKALLETGDVDLVILDWGLPDISGMEMLEWIRNNLTWSLPVLFLTARTEEKDIVGALENGADDFVSKPARRDEFLARVKAVARRSGVMENRAGEMEVGRYRFQRDGRICEMDGETVSLTAREFELAWYLFARRGQVLPREKIYRAVWGNAEMIHTRTIDTHMSRIRKKLDLRPENGWHLSSVYHYGYRLERLGAASGDVKRQS